MTLHTREIEYGDIPAITGYWLGSDTGFLRGMGVDPEKMPREEQWHEMLSLQLSQPYDQKQAYCIIWEVDGQPVGHCNVNNIIFGREAFMHLHMWNDGLRHRGHGTELVKSSLPYFFKNLNLQKICCQPYALNPAPNKTLQRIGFDFVKTYTTTPGYLNFEQEVNLWELTRDVFIQL